MAQPNVQLETGQCSGCMKTFTQSGLEKHLSQTRKPACLKFRHLRNLALLLVQQPRPEAPENLANSDHHALPPFPEDVDMDAPPVPFEGDFYGDYADDFFDDADEQHPPVSSEDSHSSSDDDDDDDDDDLDAPSWERPPCDIPTPTLLSSTYPATPANSTPGPPLPTSERRAQAEASVRRKTFIVRYPSETAGAPISDSAPVSNAHASYRNALECDDNTPEANVYYPFASRLDWQVARWAKLRGPGSTAFDDLLGIEEVRAHAYHCL